MDVDQSEPTRAPGSPGRFGQLGPAPQGRSPGAPARPINIGSQLETERDLLPFEDEPVNPPPAPAVPRGARSKVKSKPHPRPAAVPQRPVYIAPPKGKRYHKAGCSKALYMSGELVPLIRDEAESRKSSWPCSQETRKQWRPLATDEPRWRSTCCLLKTSGGPVIHGRQPNPSKPVALSMGESEGCGQAPASSQRPLVYVRQTFPSFTFGTVGFFRDMCYSPPGLQQRGSH